MVFNAIVLLTFVIGIVLYWRAVAALEARVLHYVPARPLGGL